MNELTDVSWIYNARATIDHRMRVNSLTWVLWFSLVLGASLLLGLRMVTSAPKPAFIVWLLFIVGIAAILYRPRYGVYLIIFLSLVGDKGLIYWYPFHLNFSSGESLLFLNSQMIFSPMEVYLVITLLSWLVPGAIQRRLRFYGGELSWIALIFLAFVVFGLVYGIGRGGDLNIGLWEARAIFYLPVMLILTSNLITERDHIFALIGYIISALFIEGVIGFFYNFSIQRENINIAAEAIMEHSASIHMNSFLIFLLAVWLYKGSLKSRFIIPLMAIPVLVTYLMIQRRAAFSALAIAIFFMAFILYKESRRAFWIIVPFSILVFTALVIAGWNSSGILGFPARSIKSQFFPQYASMRDQASDIYRIIENYNITYTIKQAPLTGVGFGQMFTMVISLPDISFFVWYRYITHNSIGWIWMKTGMGGFVAMLFLVGLSIMTGVRVLFGNPGRMISAVILTATLYIVMHFIFAYVDMSWDNQSMTYIGTMMGIIACVESVTIRGTLSKLKTSPGPGPLSIPRS